MKPKKKEPNLLRRVFGITLDNPGNVRDHTHHVYQTDYRGVVSRVSPQRPWHGKSQRRKVLKARRLAREEAK